MAITNTSRFFSTGLIITSVFITACTEPADNNDTITLTGTSVSKGDTAISVAKLSERIIKQQADFVLYDIRDKEEFSSGHIKTARLSSVDQLLAGTDELPPGKDILIYSSLSDKAAQLAALLRVKSINAYYLSGGYDKWQQQMSNVSGSPSSSSAAQAMAKQQAVSCWFEGDYVATAGLIPKVKPTNQTKGYVPSLEPVSTEQASDELGLGLSLGLGPEEPTDELGLGLDLGLGPDKKPPRGKLNIGEGC